MPVYIYDAAGWPALRVDGGSTAELLAAARLAQGRLLGRAQALGFAPRRRMAVEALSDEVHSSSAIEGENLDRAQVRSSVARRLGIESAGAPRGDDRIEGIVAVQLDATQQFEQPFTAERLFGWHAALFPTGRSGLRPIRVAAWRDDSAGPMRVLSGPYGRERVHFEAPEAARVPAMMAEFIEWFDRRDDDPLLHAALAHLWFVTVHPFDDGNGRLARAITEMALTRSDRSPERFYSMSSQICAERKQYYDALERAQKGGMDVTPWVCWFLGCLLRAIDGAEATLDATLAKERFWSDHRSQALNPRQRDLLNRLLDGFQGKLTTAKWAKLAKCSHDTALRDIQDLIAKGVLLQEPAGGRSTSYSLKPTE